MKEKAICPVAEQLARSLLLFFYIIIVLYTNQTTNNQQQQQDATAILFAPSNSSNFAWRKASSQSNQIKLNQTPIGRSVNTVVLSKNFLRYI